MKKIVLTILSALSFVMLFAQQDSLPIKPSSKINLTNRPNDHFMVQFSLDNWTGMPDSIASHQSGFSRGFNFYIMSDKPFKSNPHFSLGIGIGIGSSNITFKKMNVNVKSTTALLPFVAVDSTNHFKRYKLSTSYLEVPVELRYSSNPENPSKSWKIALGGKIGTLINAHTKGKDLQDKNNQLIDSYKSKENSKTHFNGTRLAATARIGYGVISLFGSYQITNILKDNAGPNIKAYQIGITLSGL